MENAIITSKEIGLAIRRRRKELGISQERLAEILEVSYQQIQRYENGTNKLNIENIQVIARALSVPITFFLRTDIQAMGASTASLPSDEKTLLEIFTKISSTEDKRLVIALAQLAARKR
ncbi:MULTISPECIES: helix-turn-helix domain-containing protein [Geobacter]|uniref:HTH cro/C1-type domain-containing protein n=1 Tax=Geobacter pickeringii TaxID=345632 RepID=A0A0B5BHY3_9BACT|nr:MULTISPECIES: helix-turn-helix transcriptional regulator [Geobacter]AJE03656.1 hypothetical protein GPICK_10110 [Geobacter pickeringii]MBT1077186.1 helix-turn-helix transcriptional regulator [Geobacter grbiciae]